MAAWREAPYFTDAERAALALTEAVTRLADRPDPVPDEIWDEAARHYDEEGLAALLLSIATTNVFNRLNAPTEADSPRLGLRREDVEHAARPARRRPPASVLRGRRGDDTSSFPEHPGGARATFPITACRPGRRACPPS